MSLSPSGVPFSTFLGVAPQQPASYWLGFLGGIPDADVWELLESATNGDAQLLGSEWVQNFHETHLLTTDGAINYNNAPGATDEGTQGRFDFVLDPTAPYVKVIMKWYVELASPLASYNGGSADDVITRALARANQVLQAFWGGRFLACPQVPAAIPIKTQAIRVHDVDEAFFHVRIYNDATRPIAMRVGKTMLEVVNMEDHEWHMRETLTFSALGSGVDAGNGPHEYGHMMGLPHDINTPTSVMFTTDGMRNATGTAELQYKYGGSNRPYASHYKLIKLWADHILSTHVFPGQVVDCLVVT